MRYVWLFALGLMFLRPIASCYSGFNDAALHLIFPLSKVGSFLRLTLGTNAVKVGT